MSTRTTTRTRSRIVVLALAGLLAAACSTPAGQTVSNARAARPAGSWPYPNGNLANTRNAAGSVITAANVARLAQA
jgi:hypothetical protein